MPKPNGPNTAPNTQNQPPQPERYSARSAVMDAIGVDGFDDLAESRVSGVAPGSKGYDRAVAKEKKALEAVYGKYSQELGAVFDVASQVAEAQGIEIESIDDIEAYLPGAKAYVELIKQSMGGTTLRQPDNEDKAFMAAMKHSAEALQSVLTVDHVSPSEFPSPAAYDATINGVVAEYDARERAAAAEHAAQGRTGIAAKLTARADAVVLYRTGMLGGAGQPTAARDFMNDKLATGVADPTMLIDMQQQERRDVAQATWAGTVNEGVRAKLTEQNESAMETHTTSVDDARQKLAALSAKRQKGFGLSRQGGPEFQAAKADYDTAVRQLIALEIEQDQRGRDKKITNKNELIMHIARRTAEMGNALETDIVEQYKTNDTRLAKVVNFLAGRKADGSKDTRKWVTVTRIGLGAGLAVGTLVSGGLLGVAAGAGAGVYAGTSVYGAMEGKARTKRLARGTALQDHEAIGGALTEADTAAGTTGLSNARLMKMAGEHAANTRDKDTASQRRRRLGRVAAGTAVGLLAGGLAVDRAGSFADALNGIPDASTLGDGPYDTVDATFFDGNIGLKDAYIVNPGENLTGVFQRMNIPQTEWQSIVDKAGPKLVEMGSAYWQPDGSLAWTGAGQIPDTAFTVIQFSRPLS